MARLLEGLYRLFVERRMHTHRPWAEITENSPSIFRFWRLNTFLQVNFEIMPFCVEFQ